MIEDKTLSAIDSRYSKLAESACCLSCGGAVNYSAAKPGEVFLDLGSGRGTDALRIAEAVGKEGFVYGIDASDGMLERAKRTQGKLGIENVSFIKAELSSLPVETESIDCVISNCTINHSSKKQDVWNEIYRVLKPGGRFVVSDIYSIVPVPDEYKNDPEAIAECWAGAVTKDEYIKHVFLSGLTIEKIADESAPYEKGKISVASFTLLGSRHANECGSCGCCGDL